MKTPLILLAVLLTTSAIADVKVTSGRLPLCGVYEIPVKLPPQNLGSGHVVEGGSTTGFHLMGACPDQDRPCQNSSGGFENIAGRTVHYGLRDETGCQWTWNQAGITLELRPVR